MLELIATFIIYYTIFSVAAIFINIAVNFLANRYLDKVSANLRASTLSARGW